MRCWWTGSLAAECAVEALYRDAQGELLNPQLMYYLDRRPEHQAGAVKHRKLVIDR